MIEELRKKAAAEDIKNIQPIVSDGCDMPLADKSVDIVCANMFLHHIEEPVTAIKEMYRILKPGGRVFLADLTEHGSRELKEAMHDIWQGFSQDEICKWFSKCGFKIERFDTFSKKFSGRKTDEGIFIMIAVK